MGGASSAGGSRHFRAELEEMSFVVERYSNGLFFKGPNRGKKTQKNKTRGIDKTECP